MDTTKVLHPGKLFPRLIAAFLAASLDAGAEESKVPIRIELNTTGDCRSPDVFYERVEERTIHVRRAKNGELGWSVTVTVKAVGARRLARMTLMATEGEWIERELLAPDCSDALDALAVVLAVLIDTAVDQAAGAEKAKPPKNAGEPSKPIALPRVAAGVYIPWIDDPDFFEKRGVSLSPTRIIASIVGSAELDTQLLSGSAFGMGFGFEIERWSASRLRPRLGLSLGWATSDSYEGQTSASLQRWSLRTHLCPFDLFQTRAVNLRPCARVDAGYVYAHVRSSVQYRPDENVRRGMVRLSPYLQFVIAPHPDVELRIDGGLDLLAVRPTIETVNHGGQTQSSEPNGLGAYAALGVAVKY